MSFFSASSCDPQKYKGMMEKIDISDASIAEAVRGQMAVATDDKKGLLDANSSRFVKSKGLFIAERNGCIKLYSGSRRTSVAAIISSGRIEAGPCGTYILAFTMADLGSFSCDVSKINKAMAARFYYVKDSNNVSIYMVSNVDYSIGCPVLRSKKRSSIPRFIVNIML